MAYPNYNYGMPKSAVAIGIVTSATLLAAVALTALGARTGLMIVNPSTNTGNLYFNLSSTASAVAVGGHQFKLEPGQWFSDESDETYQGAITAIMDGPGGESVNLYVGVKPS